MADGRPLHFRKAQHLRRPAEFDRVFRYRCSVSNAWLLIYGMPNGLAHCRLGLSVSRKVGGAVRRNRLRRLYREAYRLSRSELPTGLDLILIPRSADEPKLDDLVKSLPVLAASLTRRIARKEQA